MRIDKYNKVYWLELQERYFEAETTTEEEQMLMQFAATTTDQDFQELKAVMGFVCAQKAQRPVEASPKTTTRRKSGALLRNAIAAVFILTIAISAVVHFNKTPDCIAYVGGERITDKAQVEQLMNDAVGEMCTQDIAEAQLAEMFND